MDIGTREAFNVTAQISEGKGGGLGSVRRTKEFFVHPDDIKQTLEAGDAFYVTKVGGFALDKVRVKFSC